MIGGAGDDLIATGNGQNWVFGDAGIIRVNQAGAVVSANSLAGSIGKDVITGGADRDTLIGGLGVDRLSGQGGNDLVFGDAFKVEGLRSANVKVTRLSGSDVDTIAAGAGDDLVFGDRGDQVALGVGRDQDLTGRSEIQMRWLADKKVYLVQGVSQPTQSRPQNTSSDLGPPKTTASTVSAARPVANAQTASSVTQSSMVSGLASPSSGSIATPVDSGFVNAFSTSSTSVLGQTTMGSALSSATSVGRAQEVTGSAGSAASIESSDSSINTNAPGIPSGGSAIGSRPLEPSPGIVREPAAVSEPLQTTAPSATSASSGLDDVRVETGNSEAAAGPGQDQTGGDASAGAADTQSPLSLGAPDSEAISLSKV